MARGCICQLLSTLDIYAKVTGVISIGLSTTEALGGGAVPGPGAIEAATLRGVMAEIGTTP